MFRALACVLLLAAALQAAAQPRFDFDTAPGRLSKDVVSLRYALSFDVDPARDVFGGEASISVRVRKAVGSITVHAHELKPGTATLSGARESRALRIERDEAASLWRLTPVDGQPIAAGEHMLRIAYTGVVHSSGEGLYRVEHQVNGKRARVLATQLEEIHARTLFPGFDEPAFRAVFEISVKAPRGLDVASNMPRVEQRAEGGKTLHRFAPTPSMPSYLVALTVGRFDVLTGDTAGVPLRILTAPGKREQARYALEVTQQVLPFYNAYFGVPYALPKLDQLAVPGVRDGAMEDWGLISYTEAMLLLDPNTSSPQTQREIFATAAHEIAHQWFGNLVTASSWDEIWLNEAFATWMEHKASEHFNPAWQVPLHARRYIDRTMLRDATAATRAIRSGPVDETKVTDQFDDITYTKGGAVLSMLEQWLGPEVFQRGLAAYMRERQFSNATAGDLWHHMAQASGKDVAPVASSWTDQPGYPLVQVQDTCRDGRTQVTLSQRRFALQDSLAPQQWKIPVRLARGPQQLTTLLDTERATVELDGCSQEPLVANAGGRGFYRVDYDAAQWQRLTASFAKLAPADRVALLSDSFALVQAGQLPMSVYLGLLAQLPKVTDTGRAALFTAAAEELNFLDEALADTSAQVRLRERGRALFGPELARLGWQPLPGDDAETLKLRGKLIEQLARFDDADAIREARARFDRGALPPSTREGVLMAVGMHADRARFERLSATLRQAASEEDRWLYASALAGGRDRQRAQTLLAIALNGTLPTNIAAALPALVAERSPFGDLAYRFTVDNWPALARLAGTGPFGGSLWLLPNAAAGFNERERAAQMLADQRRTAGRPGAAAASAVAARIDLRAAVKAREQAALAMR